MRAARLFSLFPLSVLALVPACQPTPDLPATEAQREALTRFCVVDAPIASDGYTEFAPVEAERVTRKRFQGGRWVEDTEKTVTATADQIRQAEERISKFITRIDNEVPRDRRRVERYSGSSFGQTPEPYCLFHGAGRPTYGTVLLFHGFNDRPHQQANLASYLFHSGFNVYNVFLPFMYTVAPPNPADDRDRASRWPKTTYSEKIVASATAKMAVPENQAKLSALLPTLDPSNPTPEQVTAFDGIFGPELTFGKLNLAWSNPGGPEYRAVFNFREPQGTESLMELARSSDFLDYVRDAKERLADVASMKGPVFVGGLSVGGAVAVALAEADDSGRIRGVVAHAPWFRQVSDENHRQVMFAGPLDEKITLVGQSYPMSFSNHKVPFSPASFAAVAALGVWAQQPENVERLAKIPTAFVTTDAEDSAHNPTTRSIYERIGGASPHAYHAYGASLSVGHAFTDPENYGDENGPWNRRWRSLYQESYRFYLTNVVDDENLKSTGQARDLRVGPGDDQRFAFPQVPCRLKDFPARCP